MDILKRSRALSSECEMIDRFMARPEENLKDVPLLLSSRSEVVHLKVIEAVEQLAKDKRNRQALVESAKTLQSLVQLLGSPNVEVQVQVARVLGNLALDCVTSSQRIGQCKGAVAGLLQLLSSSVQEAQLSAAGALINLASQNQENQQLIGDCQGAIASLVQLLSSSSRDLQRLAAEALTKLAYNNPTSKQQIGKCPGAIAGLVQLLSSSERAVQRQAVAALQCLASDSALNTQRIGGCEGVTARLVQLLEIDDQELQLRLAATIGHLANGSHINKQRIGDCQAAIDSLVQLLRSGNQGVQCYAAYALMHLASHHWANSQRIVMCQGAIAGLVQLLSSSSKEVQRNAADTLGNLLVDVAAQPKIAACQGAIASLVKLLSSDNSYDRPLRLSAACVLTGIALNSSKNQAAIREHPGATGGLVKLISDGRDRAWQKRVIEALQNLLTRPAASIGSAQLQGLQQGPWFIPGLVQLLSDGHGDVCEQAAQALEVLGVQSCGFDAQTLQHEALDVALVEFGTQRLTLATGGRSSTPPRPSAAAYGEVAFTVAADLAGCIPMFGQYISSASKLAARIVKMGGQADVNEAKAMLLANRAGLIHGVLQDFCNQAQRTSLQLPQGTEGSLVLALQQVKGALERAYMLLGRWGGTNTHTIRNAVERFVMSENDLQDLTEVDQQLCISYNQLADVLNICSLFQVQLLVTTADTAASAHRQDVANFEKNLISLAGGVSEVQSQLQQHRKEMQVLWPLLESMGVQMLQLGSMLAKLDSVADGVLSLEQKLDELDRNVRSYISQQKQGEQQQQQQEQRQNVLVPKPDMLIARDNITLMETKLGRGGFATVYLAKYRRLDVAVKVFSLEGATEEDMKPVYREAILLWRLGHHPNIIRCYGMISNPAQDPSSSFPGSSSTSSSSCGAYLFAPELHGSLVMEKCDTDLHKLLHDDTMELSLLDKVHIAHDIAAGMCYLHFGCGDLAPVVHGDLKPSNILVNHANGRSGLQVKVCDFGISRTCEVSSNLYTRLTGKQLVGGSLKWVAPEVFEHVNNEQDGNPPFTTEIDVYAFGIILFEVVTRSEPFRVKADRMFSRWVCEGLRPPAKKWLEQQYAQNNLNDIELVVCKQLVGIMESCWAANPVDRPSFEQVAGQLGSLAELLN